MTQNIHSLLKHYYGYENFRDSQEQIISTILTGRDTVVLMPTGGGKSLCFQIPALALGTLTLVISPLIALMKDQVDALLANGINAAYLNSTLTADEVKDIERKLQSGQITLLYVAPERLSLPEFQRFLSSLPIKLIAVDEAHCISEWGHEFRPEYRNLKTVRKALFPHVPVIALTATATQTVQKDIVKQLEMKDPYIHLSSFNRGNLKYTVRHKSHADKELLSLLRKYPNDSSIIYCLSRKDTERLAGELKAKGLSARAYHAGMSSEERQRTQELFQKDEVKIIVATIAFGMGIDKPNVRLVVHYHLPKSIEGYYQETGRAGRDGLESECVLYYSSSDKGTLDYFINKIESLEEREHSREKLQLMMKYAEITTCRRKYLLEYFGEKWEQEECGKCDICTTTQTRFDATVIVQKILSAIIKTGERFGMHYVIDVLRGSKRALIIERGHTNLSVYGIGKEYKKELLQHIAEELIKNEYLKRIDLEYASGIVKLTEKGIQFLKNKETIDILAPITYDVDTEDTKTTQTDSQELFELLRKLRKQIADSRNVPPFIIFGDKTLLEMASKMPRSLDKLALISGVGDKKLADLGSQFLEVIEKFAQEHEVPESIQTKTKSGKVKVRSCIETKRLLETMSIQDAAKARSLTISTIITHIEELINAGEHIELKEQILPAETSQEIKTAFSILQTEQLKPIFEHLKGKYSYDTLRLGKLQMLLGK
ncbi:MAG: DNA helicase RecQ [Candidatus Gracilibacteria bacterium]